MEFASRRPRLAAGGRAAWPGGAASLVGAAGLVALAVLAGLGATGCRARRAAPPAAGDLGRGAGPSARATFLVVGAVRDVEGQGVPGARVLFVREGAADASERQTTSGGEGAFRIDDVPAGRYTVIVDTLGLGSVEPRPVDVPGTFVDVRLPTHVRWLGGRVDAAGKPVAGARVLLGGEGARAPRETRSADDGTFRFAVLETGRYSMRATHVARASATARGLTAASRDLVLELVDGVVIEGEVVDDDGRGRSGVEVRAETGADDPLPAVGVTSADGHFGVGPLPPGHVRVGARAPGSVLRAPASLALAVGVAPPPVRLVLARGAALAGRIVDARGAAVAGAEVRCLVAGDADVDDLTVLDGALPLAAEAAALGSVAGRALGATRTARTDARGGFRIGDLLPGPVRLEITRAPFAPLDADAGTLAPGASRDVGALTLRDGVAVTGSVHEATGAAVNGARVTVTPPVGVYAETDGAGAFALALPPGRYTLTATAAGLGARATVDVASSPLAPVSLVLAPVLSLAASASDGVVAGVARDSGRRPLARARVRAFALDASATAPATPGPPPAGAAALGVTRADAGGHFSLGHLPRQAVLLELDAADYPLTYAVATPGAAVELTAPIAGGVDGEVRERATGAVVPRARVDATGPDGQRAAAGAHGGKGAGLVFRLTRLRPGPWTLTASAPGYRSATRDVDVPASSIVGETSVRGLRLELEPSR
jgi:Carboxypeptidase regulatory-like domain